MWSLAWLSNEGGTFWDYTIYGNQDPRLAYYPEYRDEQGYRRNKKVNDKQKQIIKLTKQDLFKHAFLGSFITNEKSMMQVSNLI